MGQQILNPAQLQLHGWATLILFLPLTAPQTGPADRPRAGAPGALQLLSSGQRGVRPPGVAGHQDAVLGRHQARGRITAVHRRLRGGHQERPGQRLDRIQDHLASRVHSSG